MATTLKRLAEMLGVSPATISRVVNEHPNPRVSEANRKRILQAARKLGYRPSPAARSLAMQSTMNVGFLMDSGGFTYEAVNPNPMLTNTIRALQGRLHEKFYGMSLAFISREDPVGSFHALFEYRPQFDSVVIPTGVSTPALVEAVQQRGLPCAVLYDSCSWDWPVHTFVTDSLGDLHTAIDHLLAIGRRRIALIGWAASGRSEQAFPELLAEHGLPCKESWRRTVREEFRSFFSYRDHGRREMSSLLEEGEVPDAVICTQDQIAFGVIDVLRQRGITPGRDVAVIGRGDLERDGQGPFGDSCVTTIRWPYDVIGTAVADALVHSMRCKNDTKLEKRFFVGELIVRSSTCPDGDSDT